ncbi:ThuA domain-containing protein [Gemmata sp. G18]|uniref:ThuA domain-containing protein n=1 Tax=Gemmata palustris TaxID=2822762 RepID=A0ABS5C4G2_9BACT|nr:ThuA domain-containing protein [Gemmata palustris]MBP3960720.1 ThuA domain-containing protein [Gemmata palustris]
MLYLRLAFVLLCTLTGRAVTHAVEPWADDKLPVTDGIALWLDAGRIDAARKANNEKPPAGGKLATWFDGSGRGRNLKQPAATAQPKIVKVGDTSIVRFDGETNHLRFTGGKDDAKAFTAFVVVAPRTNPGAFRGFFALNAPNGRDYESGFTIDMGPNFTPRFTDLNVEGRGFGGWQNLLKPGGDFGKLYQLEVRGNAEAKSIRLFTDGVASGERPWAPAALSLAEITVGARFYTNGPGAHEVRGPARCDIAEVLFYDRALTDDEAKKVRAYLTAKHANLKQNLPPEPPAAGERLVPVTDPPPVQVFVPGFTVKQLPVDLTNVNNVKYRADGALVALCYNGDIWVLKDTDGDGVEDKAELFWENKGRLRAPIGMDLTPPGYKHGAGVFVACKGKVTLIVDTDNDGKADKEIIVADGWKEIANNVDALGVALDPKDGAVYYGRGAFSYTDAYRVDKDSKSQYSLKDEEGTIIRVAPDFKTREIVATGIRFPVGLRFNKAGDLFCTDQEGATWLPNGNPLDELLHIQRDDRRGAGGEPAGGASPKKVRHYGFPPRHPKHLPDVIDEPSTFDYGPQHQSTCGFCFNEPVKDGGHLPTVPAGTGSSVARDGQTFGPKSWAGDAIVTGESRGKLYRTQLVKTDAGYVAKNHLFACLNMLTIDCCIAPDGSLVVACHSGGPDWGSGPTGKGKLYKISYTDKEHPQPVLVYPAGPREVRVEFDRPVDPQLLRDVLAQTKLTAGKFVRAGDRFETLWPGYAVVQAEKLAPRFNVPVHSAQLTPDRRTLVLATDPLHGAGHYALTLPGMGRPAKDKTPKGALTQHPQIDLDFDLSGCEATWFDENGKAVRTGWLPTLDLSLAQKLTAGSAAHAALWEEMKKGGYLVLKGQLNLIDMLRPAVQPGSKIDYQFPKEQITVKHGKSLITEAKEGGLWPERLVVRVTPGAGDWRSASVTWFTAEDKSPRPFPLRRALVPWADTKAEIGKPIELARPKELDGGSWARGRKVFFSEQAACFKCHSVHSQGGSIGPDLTNLIHRDYGSVVRDITQPSFAINPDFLASVVTLKDDRVLTGVIRTVGDKLHIGDNKGTTTIVDRTDVESIKASPLSVMPDDLLKKLPPDQARDLLTFLLTPAPRMPDDYVGPETRPKPRTLAEVNAALAGAPNPPEKTRPIRVVLVAGPKDHGKGEHDYPAWQKAWAELLAADDKVEVVTAMEWPAKEEFQKADAMVFFQRGDWDAKRAAEIDAFLERGGGLTYLHWAVDGQKDSPGFAKRIGLTWGNGSKFRHGPVDLDFKDAKHPIARNFDKLKLVDESYWQLTGDLPKERVLGWANEDAKPQPLFWSVERGKGRVFVSIPGHYSWTFDDPLFRVLLLRGIAWTAKEPVDRFNDLVLPGADVAK